MSSLCNICYARCRSLPDRGVMSETADRVTRFAADLVDSATVEGARQSRSAKQQLDHWARVGRAVSSHQTRSAAPRRGRASRQHRAQRIDRRRRHGVQRRDRRRHPGEPCRRPTTARCWPREASPRLPSTTTGDLIEYRPDGSRVIGADAHALTCIDEAARSRRRTQRCR